MESLHYWSPHAEKAVQKRAVTESSRWQDVWGGIIGGEEAVTEVRRRNQARIDGHRLAERRKALGLT